MKHLAFIIATTCTVLLSSSASADWGLTLGADNQIDRFKDTDTKDTDAVATLGIEYRGESLNIDSQNGLSYDLLDSDKAAFELLMTSHNREADDVDRKVFKGMDSRKESVDIGARTFVNTALGPVSFAATRDIRRSKGYTADLKLGGIEPHADHWNGKREVKFAGVAGVRYQSDKTANYYYGVKGSEATADRAAYKAGAATTPYIGLESKVNLTKRVSFDAGLIYEKRDNDIKNSPLTNDKDHDVIGKIGFTYWF